MHVHVRFPFLTRRIDRAMVDAFRTNKQTPFAASLYRATTGSRVLAQACATLFPFAFCAKPDCVYPMAHDGDCIGLDGAVLPASAKIEILQSSKKVSS